MAGCVMTSLNNQNSIQPDKAINENQSFGSNGNQIPEQAQVAIATMPRQMSIMNLIYQWQPMGFRVILNLPFIGDDQNFIFAIRNGPFIPQRTVKPHYDIVMPTGVSDELQSWTEVMSFAYNNMIPIILPSDDANDYPDPSKPVITLINYDFPPSIATIAQAFRRWRGDMQYRIRMVAGFATQGYVMCSTLKNVFSPIGIYNQFKTAPTLQRQDISFRPAMQNSYALSDTSMYRHLELTYPYDYPTPYYDQYAWISRRCVPSYQFGIKFAGPTDGGVALRNRLLQSEPHGDNWIVLGIRGNLESMQAGSQIIFELEYRCMEGFQFADPFLPPKLTSQPFSEMPKDRRVYRVPDDKWRSDGVKMPEPIVPNPIPNPLPLNTTVKREATVNVGTIGNIQVGGVGTNAKMTYGADDLGKVHSINIPAQSTRKNRKREPRSANELSEEEEMALSSLDRLRLAADRSRYLGQSSRNE